MGDALSEMDLAEVDRYRQGIFNRVIVGVTLESAASGGKSNAVGFSVIIHALSCRKAAGNVDAVIMPA